MRIWLLGLGWTRNKMHGATHPTGGATTVGWVAPCILLRVHQSSMQKPFLVVNSISDSPTLLESLGAVIIE